MQVAWRKFSGCDPNDTDRGSDDQKQTFIYTEFAWIRRSSDGKAVMEGPWWRVRREARAGERHQHCNGG